MVFGTILLASCMAIVVLMLISGWKIFVKMGEPGWKCLVPYYNMWVLLDRLRKPAIWFWAYLALTVAYYVLYLHTMLPVIRYGAEMYAQTGFHPGMTLCGILLLVYGILVSHAISKAFGHGAGFTVGLMVVPIVFIPMLAFGDDRFQPEGMAEERASEES
jgi:hypothetical protein